MQQTLQYNPDTFIVPVVNYDNEDENQPIGSQPLTPQQEEVRNTGMMVTIGIASILVLILVTRR